VFSKALLLFNPPPMVLVGRALKGLLSELPLLSWSIEEKVGLKDVLVAPKPFPETGGLIDEESED